ncbi:MAG: dynamin family protein [bacterium]
MSSKPTAEMIEDFQETVTKAPLKNKKLSDDELLLTEEISTVKEQLEQLKSKLKKTMKVVIMGEVKAGKSTLLNAITAQEIAPTDVLEATATISDIHYSAQEEAVIYKNDEIEEMGSIAEIYQILTEHNNDTEYFSDGVQVSIGLNNDVLKEFHLVDTPGLSTVTAANAEKTKNFIQESDVVLWVLNANHIGQSDVENELKNVAKMGKPIVMIINRIDEVDSSATRIKRHIKRKLGIFLEEIFTCSALEAFEARQNNDSKKLAASGLKEILEYLRTEIELNSEDIKKESITSSVKALIKNYYRLNLIKQNRIEFKLSKLKEYILEIDRYKRDVAEEIEGYLTDRFEAELFEKEKNEIVKMVNQMKGSGKLFNSDFNKKTIKKKLRQKINRDTVISWWQQIQAQLGKEMKNRWLNFAQEIDERINEDLQNLAEKESVMITAIGAVDEYDSSLGEQIKEGAFIAGAGGLGIAAYIAGIGPAAAYVTFGSAIASVVPPIAIGGAIIFGLKKMMNREDEINKFRIDIIEKINSSKREIKEKWLRAELLPAVKEKNKSIAEKLKNDFAEKLSSGLTQSELLRLKEEQQNYIQQIEEYLSVEEQQELQELKNIL